MCITGCPQSYVSRLWSRSLQDFFTLSGCLLDITWPVEKATFSINIHIPSACTSSHACICLPSNTNKRTNEKNADSQKQSLALATINQRILMEKKKATRHRREDSFP